MSDGQTYCAYSLSAAVRALKTFRYFMNQHLTVLYLYVIYCARVKDVFRVGLQTFTHDVA